MKAGLDYADSLDLDLLDDSTGLYYSDVIGLIYDIELQRFIDEDGRVIYDIYEIITPNDAYLFKHKGSYMAVKHRHFKEVLVELYFPDDDYRNGRLIFS